MRRFLPARIRAPLVPLAILGLIAPVIAAFAFVGAQFGLAIGAFTLAALVVVAARLRYDEPIEVARRADARFRMLVVAPRALDAPELAERIGELARQGSRSLGGGGEPELLVLAPIVQSRLERWASDLASPRFDAQRALAVSLATLAAAGIDAHGRVGDEQTVQAVEDALAAFPAQEVVFLIEGKTGPDVEEVRRRLDRPVRLLGPVDA
ncbi:MAG: hypothetical protein H0W09_05505 [Solirubrobacterales bacterium]|nr:hypothetical protein [Solirubrobacterales bacterium]